MIRIPSSFTITVLSATITGPDFGSDSIDDQVYTQNETAVALQLTQATAGTSSSLVYSLVGQLPIGLSFNASSRQIIGTPTEVIATRQFSYVVTDGNNLIDTIEFTIAVNVGDTLPSFSGVHLPNLEFLVNVAIEPVTLPEAIGGKPSNKIFYFCTPHLGLSFNTETRQLSGTPTFIRELQRMVYVARDADSDLTSRIFRISVVAASSAEGPDFGNEDVADQFYIVNVQIDDLVLPEAMAGDNQNLAYSLTGILPGGLTFNPATRTLSGTPISAAQARAQAYRVTDGNNLTDTINFTISVRIDGPTLSGQTIPNQVYARNNPITPLVLPEATPGESSSNLVYSLGSELPAGLTFNASTRTVSGTPTSVITNSNILYRVTDENSQSDTISFRISVEDTTPTFRGVTIADLTLQLNVDIGTILLPEAEEGDPPLVYAVDTLPTGLAFNPANRELTGTPTVNVAGQNVRYTATDNDSQASTLSFDITVTGSAPPVFLLDGIVVTSFPDQTFEEGVIVQPIQLPSPFLGNPPIVAQLIGLPTGLGFSDTNYRFSGLPTEVVSNREVTYRITDDAGLSAELVFNITVTPSGVFGFGEATVSDRTLTADSPIVDIQLPASSGGFPPIVYSLSTLPTGLAFDNGTRTISGTPTVTGSTPMTYTVEDSTGDTDTIQFTLNITQHSILTFGDIASQTIERSAGQYFSRTLPAAAGGVFPVSYSVTQNNGQPLPGTVEFDRDGSNSRILDGTIDDAGIYDLTYTATDSASPANTATLSVTINIDVDLRPTIEQPPSFLSFIENSEITPVQFPAGSGGNGTLRYRILNSRGNDINNTPVPGLIFNTTTRQLTGMPLEATDGFVTFIYEVRDSDGDRVRRTFTLRVLEDTQPDWQQAALPDLTLTINISVPADTRISPDFSPVGGNGTITRTISGTPPPGTGIQGEFLVGTPNIAGQWVIATTATDVDGDSDSITIVIIVMRQTTLSAPVLSEHNIDNITEAVDFTVDTPIGSIQMPEATGGEGTLNYSFTGLPPGLVFNRETRILSGTPTRIGRYVGAVYRVTDENGATDTLTADFEVIAAPTAFIPTLIPRNLVIQPIRQDDGTWRIRASWDPAIQGTGFWTESYEAVFETSPSVPLSSVDVVSTRLYDEITAQTLAEGTLVAVFVRAIRISLDPSGIRPQGPWVGATYVITDSPDDSLPSLSGHDLEALSFRVALVWGTFDLLLPPVEGGEIPIVYDVLGLPAGLAFNQSTRVISGLIPLGSSSDASLVIYRATDSSGISESRRFPIDVYVPSEELVNIRLENFRIVTSIDRFDRLFLILRNDDDFYPYQLSSETEIMWSDSRGTMTFADSSNFSAEQFVETGGQFSVGTIVYANIKLVNDLLDNGVLLYYYGILSYELTAADIPS